MTQQNLTDFTPNTFSYLGRTTEKVDLSAQGFDVKYYLTVGSLILGILRAVGQDIGDAKGKSIAERHGQRSIIGLLRPAIRQIDPEFHKNPDTPKWVNDIMGSPIRFGSDESKIRDRLEQILMMNNICQY